MRKSGGEFLRPSNTRSSWYSAGRIVAILGHIAAFSLLLPVRAAQASEPGDLTAQLQTASALHKQADYAHSIPILRHIVHQSPRNYMGNLLLGVDLLRSGNVKEAVAPLRTASAVRPDDGAPQAYLAEAALALEDIAMATEAYESAVACRGARSST